MKALRGVRHNLVTVIRYAAGADDDNGIIVRIEDAVVVAGFGTGEGFVGVFQTGIAQEFQIRNGVLNDNIDIRRQAKIFRAG